MDTRPIVLVRQDSSSYREVMNRQVPEDTCRLVFAEDGPSTERSFAAERPHLVLVDVEISDEDGYATVRRLRELPGGESVPIVAIAGRDDEQERTRAKNHGCTALLRRPTGSRDWIEALRRHAILDPTSEPHCRDDSLEGFGYADEIHGDPELSDLIPEYLESRREECRLIREAVEGGDFGKIRTMGHGMKGSGASYGFAEIGRIGSALEAAAKARDADSIRASNARLRQYLDLMGERY